MTSSIDASRRWPLLGLAIVMAASVAGCSGHVRADKQLAPERSPEVHASYDGSRPCLTDASGVKQCEDGIRVTAKGLPSGSYKVTIHNSSGGTLSGTSSKAIVPAGGTWDSGNGWSNACGNTGLQFYVTVGSYKSNNVNYHACGG